MDMRRQDRLKFNKQCLYELLCQLGTSELYEILRRRRTAICQQAGGRTVLAQVVDHHDESGCVHALFLVDKLPLPNGSYQGWYCPLRNTTAEVVSDMFVSLCNEIYRQEQLIFTVVETKDQHDQHQFRADEFSVAIQSLNMNHVITDFPDLRIIGYRQ